MTRVMTYSQAEGLRVLGVELGDPAIAVLKSSGWQFASGQRFWFLPRSRGRAIPTVKVEKTIRSLQAADCEITGPFNLDDPADAESAASAREEGAATPRMEVPADDLLALRRARGALREVNRRLSGSNRVSYVDSYGKAHRFMTPAAAEDQARALVERKDELEVEILDLENRIEECDGDVRSDVAKGDLVLVGSAWLVVHRVSASGVVVARGQLAGAQRTFPWDRVSDLRKGSPTRGESP